MQTLNNIIRSYRGMPLWVQIWIGVFLAPANIASAFFIGTDAGLATALAGIGVLVFNGFLCWMNQGFSKVLAIPHLIFWGPLQVYLGMLLFSPDWTATTATYYFAWIVFVFNGISLAFDIFDTKDWIQGKREISGLPDVQPWL